MKVQIFKGISTALLLLVVLLNHGFVFANTASVIESIVPLEVEPEQEVMDEREVPQAGKAAPSAAPVTTPPAETTSPVTPLVVTPPVVNPVAEPVPAPAAEPTPEPVVNAEPKKDEAQEAVADTAQKTNDETGIFIDPEFGLLIAPAEKKIIVSDSASNQAPAEGFKATFDFGGEYRFRLGQDLSYESSLIKETPESLPKKIGTEDVIDARTSVEFWTRMKLSEKVQAFLELYAEYSIVGKRNESQPTIIFNGKNYRQYFKFEPREIYFDFFFGAFDLRVGNQIVSWGTMASKSPSDRVNPINPSAFYWSDISGTKKPIIAIKGIYHVSDLAFEFVVAPFFSPPALDIYGQDYSLFRYGSVYGSTTYPVSDINYYLDSSKTIGEYPELLTTKSPGANPLNSQLGFRFSGSKNGFDFGLSYWFGFEELPETHLDPELRSLGIAISKNDTNKINGILQNINSRISSGTPIDDLVSSSYHRKHSVAAEFGTTIWEFGFKAEAAFLPNKLYYTEGFYPVEHHTFAYAVGLDLIKTDLGKLSTLLINVELFGSVLFGVDDGEQISFATDKNLGLFTTFRLGFLDNDLNIEATSQVNFSTQDFVLIPQISYSPVTNLTLTIGVMILEAWAKEPIGFELYTTNTDRKDTLFGQFSNNDQAFFLLRYSF